MIENQYVKDVIKNKIIFDMAEQKNLSILDVLNILQFNEEYRKEFDKEFKYHLSIEYETYNAVYKIDDNLQRLKKNE